MVSSLLNLSEYYESLMYTEWYEKLHGKLPKRINDLQNLLNALIRDFHGKKRGLQPLLFLTFVIQTTLLVATLFLAVSYYLLL